jgi:hypothetical protein
VTTDHSTLSANRATGGYGGGGTEQSGPGGTAAAGGIYNTGTLRTRNTIIAANTVSGPGSNRDPDLSGNLGSRGHNLVGDSTGGSGFDSTDLLDVDPQLGPLQDNGGSTQTMALLPGSPAIDAGDNRHAPDWDQRGAGFPRIVNGTIDIGAFEFQGDGACAEDRLEANVLAALCLSASDRSERMAWT